MQQADRAHSATGTLASPGNLDITITNVFAFPDNPVARARRELRYCRNLSMLDKWVSRVRKLRGLSSQDRLDLACRYGLREVELRNAGGR